MYLLERELTLATDAKTLWEFLATPANLNEITPPDLCFQVHSDLPARMHNGLTILYTIKIPVFGRRRWLTEIKHIREGVFFVDEQRLGPYKFWYHQHRIKPIGEQKTRMTDRVSYQLPYGFIGVVAHKIWVAKMLQRIFDFREQRLIERFGQ